MTTVPFKLDQESKVKLHFQLYQKIIDSIKSGKFFAGEKLPSVRMMADELSISRNTVLAAYKQLTDEGYIFSKAKSGFIVNSAASFANSEEMTIDPSPEETTESEVPTVEAILKQRKGTDIQIIPVPEELCEQTVSIKEKNSPKNKPEYSEKQLRKQLALFLYNQRHVTCTSNQLIVANDTDTLLKNIYTLLFKPMTNTEGKGLLKLALQAAEGKLTQNEILAVSEYAPKSFFEIAHAIGIKTVIIHQSDKNGIDIAELETYDANGIIVFPSNWYTSPTNETEIAAEETADYEKDDSEKMYDPRDNVSQRKRELLEWADKKDCRYIIEFDYERSAEAIPALQYFDKKNKVIYLSVLPSGTALMDYPVSYIVLPPALLAKYHELFGLTSCLLSTDQQIEAQDTIYSGKIYEKIAVLFNKESQQEK